MEERSFENMLRSFKEKDSDTWLMNVMQLNMDCIINMQTQKAKSKLTPVAIIKIVGIFLGLLWVWLLGSLCFAAYTVGNIFFTVSAGAVMAITIFAIAVYIKHLVLISQVKYSDDIIYTQEKLAELQTSTMQITRILFLQAPFYSTWFLTPALLANAGIEWIIFQLVVTGTLTFFSIWLFINISLKNANKKWFKILFGSSEWTNVSQAISFMKEVDAFKKEEQF